MKRLIFVLLVACMLMLAGCGSKEVPKDSSETKETTETKSTETTSKTTKLDLSDVEGFCDRLIPNPQNLGLRSYAEYDTQHKITYGKRAKCSFTGMDPDKPPFEHTSYLEVEVECPKQKLSCSDLANRVSDKKKIGGDVYSDEITNVECHSLGTLGSENFVHHENGCFFIVYKATPPFDEFIADKDGSRKSTTMAVAKLVAANLN